jgi:hypothetical protein
MLIVLLDEPGVFVFGSAEDGFRDPNEIECWRKFLLLSVTNQLDELVV